MTVVLRNVLLAFAMIVILAPAAHAVQPDEVLDDPALEERARAITLELRCLVCQNQSVDDSNAPLARDLRILVRDRLLAGDSDAEVVDYVVSRYGDYVLLRPPFRTATWLLWLGPFVVLAIAVGLLTVVIRRHRMTKQPPPAPLSDEERARLDLLMRNSE